MNPTRVLYLTGTLGLGGIERQVTDLCLGLKRAEEWESAVCCLTRREGGFLPVLESAGIPVHECRLDSRNVPLFPGRLGGLLRRVRPDLVHSHVASSLPWQIAGCRLAGIRSFIVTQQNEYRAWEKSRWPLFRIRLYYRLCRRHISAYTAVSERVRQHLAHLVQEPPLAFPVIYNSVDVERFRPRPELREAARAELGLQPGQFAVGNVARLAEQKGHRYLLEAAQIVNRQDPTVRFLVVGEGPLRPALEGQIEAAGLQGVVSLLGRRADVPDLLPALDCFVMPSLWEGGPIALEEAMASGLPAISTPVGVAAETLEPDCGVLVPAADPDALAVAILSLKNDPERAQSMAANAHRRARERFGLAAVLQQYTALYRRVLGRQGQAVRSHHGS